eukprot:jgi/Psemu1/38249/gm1.38249_g
MAFGQLVVTSIVEAAVSLAKQRLEGAIDSGNKNNNNNNNNNNDDDSIDEGQNDPVLMATTVTTTTTITRSTINIRGEKSTITVSRTTSKQQHPILQKQNQNRTGTTISKIQQRNKNSAVHNERLVVDNPQRNPQHKHKKMQRQRPRQAAPMIAHPESIGRKRPCHTTAYRETPKPRTTTTPIARSQPAARVRRPIVSRSPVPDSSKRATRRNLLLPDGNESSRSHPISGKARAPPQQQQQQQQRRTRSRTRSQQTQTQNTLSSSSATHDRIASANKEKDNGTGGSRLEPKPSVLTTVDHGSGRGSAVWNKPALFAAAATILVDLNEKLRIHGVGNTTTVTTTTTNARSGTTTP